MKIECSFGEIVDKMTILRLKEQKIVDETALAHVRTEISAIQEAWVAEGLPEFESLEIWAELTEVNLKLWDVENCLRECESLSDFGDHFVTLARSVYQFNDLRTKLKGKVNQMLGSSLMEQKSYTQYVSSNDAAALTIPDERSWRRNLKSDATTEL
ncbi:hypothetical protein GSUET_14660 [Geobacter sulfurreducens subsp. ethanolicus]|uniref:DUF6165 family protein n=1 Tax=Geobacter sulfurreducens TaxID=35554 RepID=UPI0025727B97|nr:DUF6165 family protein [Geobacter sulfurreducens]BEH09854.1 hypothetical protein GSUET_14660 [Geobacter sulfurreducens subsp. ethanolicus]